MTIDGLERYPSARDIEKVARNPECRTLRTALAANIDLRKLAVRLGLPEEKQSPLAIARGQRVEREILGNDAARLVERLVADGKIRTRPRVHDLGRREPNRAGMRKVAQETEAFVRDLLQGRRVPDLLLHPVLSVELGADVQLIEPDALVRYDGRSMYEPIELKSYPYREGRTDPDDLRQARRQGAVYVHALRMLVAKLGGSPDLVPASATLVFTRPGSLYPSPIYQELLEGEVRDVAHALALLDAARAELGGSTGEDPRLLEALPDMEIHYTERCLSFCALAKRCRERAREAGDPNVLGELPARVVAGTDIRRALDLLKGASPIGWEEVTLVARLRALVERFGSLREAM